MDCIIMQEQDNVATVLKKTSPGETLSIADRAMQEVGRVTATQVIPFAHKICLRRIPAGAPVIKYGQVIGRARADIAVGEYVHVHNVVSIAGAEHSARKEA